MYEPVEYARQSVECDTLNDILLCNEHTQEPIYLS